MSAQPRPPERPQRRPVHLDPDPLYVPPSPAAPFWCPQCGDLIEGDHRDPGSGRCIGCVNRGGSALGWLLLGVAWVVGFLVLGLVIAAVWP